MKKLRKLRKFVCQHETTKRTLIKFVTLSVGLTLLDGFDFGSCRAKMYRKTSLGRTQDKMLSLDLL
jgi:hypothetical protein